MKYFDGREMAHDHFYEWEADSIELEYESHEVMHGAPQMPIPSTTQMTVYPPRRYLYPRQVETQREAKELYVNGVISLKEYEGYLEQLLLGVQTRPGFEGQETYD